jgi:hypothetical protein
MPAVYPIVVLPHTYRGHYPNMAKRDAEVWFRFLEHYGDRFTGFAYNVALGGLVVDLPDFSEEDQLAWRYKTAPKIDAVGYSDQAVWIIEVKPEAQVGALGCVVGYTLLAEREAIADRPLQGAIVCEYCNVDVEWCAQQLKIAVFKV